MKIHVFSKGLIPFLFFNLFLTEQINSQSLAELTEVTGCITTQNTIEKTADSGWGNAGARSAKEIPENMDGWTECTIIESTKDKAFGLSIINQDNDKTTINYGFYFRYNGTFNLIKSGNNIGSWVSFEIGDRFRVERVSDQIKYYHNDVEISSQPVAHDVPLLVDLAFDSKGGQLNNVTISDSFQDPVPQTYAPIEWIQNEGLNLENPITKTADSGWGNAGARSAKEIPENMNGWTECTIIESTKDKAFGLSIINQDNDKTTINYGFYFRYNGTFNLIKSGNYIGPWVSFGIGDRFRVERVSDQIKYYRNDVEISSQPVAYDVPLLVDLAFDSKGGQLYNVTISDSFQDPVPQTYGPIEWIENEGLNLENPITKTADSGWGNAGARSAKEIPENMDGWTECTIIESTKEKAFGLSIINKDNNYTTIDYGFYFRYNGTFNLIKSGNYIGPWVSFGIGDRFRVERVSDQIKYYHNDVEINSQPFAHDVPLLVDLAFGNKGGQFYNVTISDSFKIPQGECSNLICVGENIGIGTNDTYGYKLAVAGSTITTEVKVALVENWPDYVFDTEYKLRTLQELETYLIENQHLPEIPSESEVTQNGINLGEMDAKLLKLIEELTLYLIEQNKELEKNRNHINELKKEVSDLKEGSQQR